MEEVLDRPKGLKVLCILSWISIGISFYFAFMSLSRGPFTSFEIRDMQVQMLELKTEMVENGMQEAASFLEKSQNVPVLLNEKHGAVLAISFLYLALGFGGVLFMYQKKKMGIHLYISYSLLAVVNPYFFLSASDIPTASVIFSAVLSGIFIFMYSRHLSWMK
jgi:hypothetical protein